MKNNQKKKNQPRAKPDTARKTKNEVSINRRDASKLYSELLKKPPPALNNLFKQYSLLVKKNNEKRELLVALVSEIKEFTAELRECLRDFRSAIDEFKTPDISSGHGYSKGSSRTVSYRSNIKGKGDE